ncbi:MAG TPA: carboxypeptidase-like regulatory domain-containing protein [Acidobacteriaceae bacterium]
MRNWIAKFALLAFLLSGVTLLRAQENASMTGTVSDVTGAVLPGATVTLTNSGQGLTYTQTTNGQGSYRFANVQPNSGYTATFSHAGFADKLVKNLTLTVGTTRTENAQLGAAGVNAQVEVSASNQAVTIDTTDAAIGNNMDVQELNQLPVLDRTTGISTLLVLQPGVDSFSGAVTGARIDQTGVTVDGLDVNDIAAGTTFAIVANAPVDSVQQFNGTVAGLMPSIGTGSGGQFQLVTKNGTNRFHGNINEYHRDTSTAANTWFRNLIGQARTPLIRNQFGGNIGGPIKRDKLFFFFDLADSRIIQSSSASRTVPLDSYRNGTLNYIHIGSNNSGGACGASSRQNTTPECISSLSPDDIAALDPAHIGFSAGVLAFLNSRYPHANDLTLGNGVTTGGFRFAYPTPDIETTYIGRIDYNMTSHHKLYGRFTINRRNAVESLPEFPSDPSTHPFIDRSYGYVVSDIWTIGSNKVNQIYYGDTISKFDFPDIYNPTGAAQYTFSGLSGPYTSFDGQKRRVPIPMIRDDFNWQMGSHNLTMGGTFKWVKTDSNLINDFNFVGVGREGSLGGGLGALDNTTARPADIAHSQTAINDYDSTFLAGLGVIGDVSTNFNYDNAGNALPAGSGGPRAYRFFQTEAYVGDTWKVTQHLTLTYGVRYQLYSVPYEAHGDMSTPVDSATGKAISLDTFVKDRVAQIAANDTSNTGLPIYKIVLAGKANKNAPNLYSPSYKDFGPRFAFSYNPAYSPKTSINGSAAIVYDRSVINAINFLQDQISYLFSNSATNNIGDASEADATIASNPRVGANLAYDQGANPTPSPIAPGLVPFVLDDGTPYGAYEGATNFVINPGLKDPYSIALNLGIQQELPGHMILKLNYVGRLGRRLLADADAGQVMDYPDPISGQTLSQAFAAMTTELRAGQPLTEQPWFDNVLHLSTAQVDAAADQEIYNGDIADSMVSIIQNYFGTVPNNVGITSQFGSNAYLTNMGNSNYHGMLLTLDKNLSQGLRFNFNYTWSHAIDNTSLSSNNNSLFSNSGFICDITRPRACRGNADFDVTQEVSSSFTYDLPFGHGRMFAANTPRLLDEAIGGWSLSGIPKYRTGLATTAYSAAYLASFDNNDPAIFTGNKSDLRVSINKENGVVYGFKGGQAGADKVLAEFRGPIGLEYGNRNLLRGPGAFYFDAGLQKNFPIIENKLNMQFRADFFNILNHPVFAQPNVNIVNDQSQFGQITSTQGNNGSGNIPLDQQRIGQFSLRLEF